MLPSPAMPDPADISNGDRPVGPSRAEFAALTARVFALERALHTATQSSPVALDSVPSEAAPATSESVPATLPLEQNFPPVFTPAEEVPFSLETRLGAQWFSRVGIAAVLVGVAWFFKFTMDQGWLAPAERIILGLLAGLGFMAWAEQCWKRHYPVSAYALFAVANGTFYLSLWAAYAVYALVPNGIALAAMAVITAWNGYRSWAVNSRVFAVYALLLGFLIPVLLATGHNNEPGLFGFLLLLDLAIAALAALKPWPFLLPSALGGTMLLAIGWAIRYSDAASSLQTDIWIVLFGLVFMLGVREFCRRHQPDDVPESFGALLPLLIAVLEGFCVLVLIDPATHGQQTWLILVLAGLSGLLALLPAGQPHLAEFRSIQHWAGLAFVTLFLLLRFHGTALVLVLAAEGLLLFGSAVHWPATKPNQLFGIGTLLLAAVLAIFSDYTGANIFWNHSMGAAAASAIALAAGSAIIRRALVVSPNLEDTTALRTITAAGAVFMLWIMGLRAIATWWWGTYRGGYVPPAVARHLQIGSQFCYSAWCMLLGVLLLAAGFQRRSSHLRWGALALLVLASFKVFLYDASALSQGYRIVSFFALGALLLAISFAYQRDWLGLRRNPGPTTLQ